MADDFGEVGMFGGVLDDGRLENLARAFDRDSWTVDHHHVNPLHVAHTPKQHLTQGGGGW